MSLKFIRYTVVSSQLLLMATIASPAYGLELSTMVTDSVSAHPEIKERIHLYRQARSDLAVSESGWRPSVDLEASTGLYNTESPATANSSVDYDSSNIELALTQNLFNGYDTTYQIEQNKARVQSALYDIYDIADNIALGAVQAYLEALKQKRLYQLSFENVESHEFILGQIRERNLSGVGRRSQLQQTEGRVARAHASLIAQNNNFQDALSELHQILGRYIDPDELVEPALPVIPGVQLNPLIDTALAQHPALQVAQSNIDASQFDYKRSLNSKYPVIDLRLATEYGDDIGGVSGSNEDTSLTLNLKYNLYGGGRFKATQQGKISVVHEQKEFLARVRRQIITTLRLAWSADQLLSKQLGYLQTHVDKASETTESYREEFFIGQRDLVDLLDSENELNNARIQYTEARFDAFAARFRLYEGIGQLFQATNVDFKIEDGNVMIARLASNREDKLPLPEDEDADQLIDRNDHCDNSLSSAATNIYGCVEPEFNEKAYNLLDKPSDPVLNADQLEVDNNGLLVITAEQLLANDLNPGNIPLQIIDISQPSIGKIAYNKSNNLVYRPVEGYVGNDTFSYTAAAGIAADANHWATVTIKVSEPPLVKTGTAQLVNFVYKKTTLTAESEKKVRSIIEQLLAAKDIYVEINTYTDNIGSEKYNIDLSERRAEALKNLLISNGIERDKIIAIGRGESDPVADNSSKEGQSINRRGVFIFRAIQNSQ